MTTARRTEVNNIKNAFQTVFRSGDPYDLPFSEGVSRRMIIFPTNHYALGRSQFTALSAAAREILGEEAAFLVDVEQWETVGLDERAREAWTVCLNNFEVYEFPSDSANIVVMQNALFSTRGTWGIVISDENHGLLGGPKEFVESVAGRLPMSETEMVSEWLKHWQDNAVRLGYDVGWLRPQLEHIYGKERADALLRE